MKKYINRKRTLLTAVHDMWCLLYQITGYIREKFLLIAALQALMLINAFIFIRHFPDSLFAQQKHIFELLLFMLITMLVLIWLIQFTGKYILHTADIAESSVFQNIDKNIDLAQKRKIDPMDAVREIDQTYKDADRHEIEERFDHVHYKVLTNCRSLLILGCAVLIGIGILPIALWWAENTWDYIYLLLLAGVYTWICCNIRFHGKETGGWLSYELYGYEQDKIQRILENKNRTAA